MNNNLNYLYEINIERPKILYHCADKKTPTLKPRVTNMKTKYRKGAHHKKAIFASERPLYAFGLERVNMMVPNKYTEREVNNWKYATWLDPEPPLLFIWYWNYIPKKPVYVYYLDPQGFKPFQVESSKHEYYHWYIEKEIKPLKIITVFPNDNKVKKESWKIATDKNWEMKKKRYKDKGMYK